MKPTTIPNTQRQSYTSKAGVLLERSYVVMPPEFWDMLRDLCHDQGRSGSQVIQSLIAIASIGNKGKTHDSSSTK
jgi:hypothetical protein